MSPRQCQSPTVVSLATERPRDENNNNFKTFRIFIKAIGMVPTESFVRNIRQSGNVRSLVKFAFYVRLVFSHEIIGCLAMMTIRS